MVLSFKLCAAFVGPAVCLLLADNDIMAEESAQTDNSARLWGDLKLQTTTALPGSAS